VHRSREKSGIQRRTADNYDRRKQRKRTEQPAKAFADGINHAYRLVAAGALSAEPEPTHDRQVVPDGNPLFAERAVARRVDKRNPARHAVDDDVVEAPDTRAEGKKHGQPIPKGDFFHKNLKKWYIREYININIMFVFPIKKINLIP
jgi:hypothetical protein